MTPFTIAIADAEIADLKARLRHTRFPDEVEDAGWDYGTEHAVPPPLRRLLGGTSSTGAPPRRGSTASRSSPTEIDGETVHFVHARGKGSNPVPLLLTNGWPSNFVELLPLVAG